jgi:hypothetical protein
LQSQSHVAAKHTDWWLLHGRRHCSRHKIISVQTYFLKMQHRMSLTVHASKLIESGTQLFWYTATLRLICSLFKHVRIGRTQHI